MHHIERFANTSLRGGTRHTFIHFSPDSQPPQFGNAPQRPLDMIAREDGEAAPEDCSENHSNAFSVRPRSWRLDGSSSVGFVGEAREARMVHCFFYQQLEEPTSTFPNGLESSSGSSFNPRPRSYNT